MYAPRISDQYAEHVHTSTCTAFCVDIDSIWLCLVQYNEKQKYHTIETVPISNRKIAQTETNAIPLTHTRPLNLLEGTSTLIKRAEVKLFLKPPPSV